MEISLILLKEIIKLFLIMLMGFALIRTGKLKTADGKAGAGQCIFDEAFDVSGDDCRVRIFV